MKRDMDTIRSLLLKLEGLNQNAYRTLLINGGKPELAIEGASSEKLDYHLSLMREKGLIEPFEGGTMDGSIYFRRLTWEGHDFLDAIRDDEIWRKTKLGAEQAGGWTFDLVKDLAEGFIKTQIKKYTDVEL